MQRQIVVLDVTSRIFLSLHVEYPYDVSAITPRNLGSSRLERSRPDSGLAGAAKLS
jgi:hypothetical protein